MMIGLMARRKVEENEGVEGLTVRMLVSQGG